MPIYLPYLSHAVLGRRLARDRSMEVAFTVLPLLRCFAAAAGAAAAIPAGGRKVIRLAARDVADIVPR